MLKAYTYGVRFLLIALTVLMMQPMVAQNARWADHFSYSNVSHIREANGYLFCSAENGLFLFDPQNGEIEKISKVNDLNDVDITAFHYSEELELLLVGYRSGEMDMLGPEENHNMLEIPLHQAFTGSKIVNHIFPYQQLAVIAGEFGLATFSLEDFEFRETTYFIQGGIYFGVKEAAVLNGVVYAASDHGVYSHTLDGFIANFTTWELANGLPNSAFQHIVPFGDQLVASSGNTVYRFDGNNWLNFGTFSSLRDLNVHQGVLSIVQANKVSNYDENFNLVDTKNFTQELNTAIKVGNNTYGGSKKFGLIDGLEEIYPDGPYNNKSWSVTTHQGQLWIAPGGLVNFNAPLANSDGFYHFNGTKWLHKKSEDMLNAKDIVDIEVNPRDSTEIYVSSWFEYVNWSHTPIGMFKFKNGQMAEHYNSENSGLLFRERIGGSVMDEEGNLYVGQSYVQPGNKTFIHKKSPSGQWTSVDLNAAGGSASARKPFIYRGYIFMALPRSQSGLKITNMQQVYTVDSSPNRGNLPTSEIISAAVDLDGTLWIGTTLGLRVLYSPIEAIQSDSYQAQPIIIEQGGIPEALLTDVQINHIEVDGANHKWVATESGGAYYFSADGTQTIHHFTSGNSPLPSNKVNDIKVDSSTGNVYFATDKGVVSYRSDAVEVGEDFGDVYAYPNPVRPDFKGEVTIKGLPIDADVRIVDVVGNLIYHTKSKGGVAKWDTKNMKGKPVASGVYLVLMTNKDATKSKQTKIAIVR